MLNLDVEMLYKSRRSPQIRLKKLAVANKHAGIQGIPAIDPGDATPSQKQFCGYRAIAASPKQSFKTSDD